MTVSLFSGGTEVVLFHLFKYKLLLGLKVELCNVTMNLSSVRTITSDAFDNGAQASHLAITNPTADVTYICKVTPTGQVASETNVKLDVYGTNFYSLNHVHNLE